MQDILSESVRNKTPGISGILMKDRIPADNQLNIRRKKLKETGLSAKSDRPGWIPPEITCNWDTNPYAYQTEEELMPAGGLHGELLTNITEILKDYLKRKGLRFLADTFILYRDSEGVKQRVSPDLLIMPFRPLMSAYDLDTEPPPIAVAEVTSPKSRLKDTDKKVILYDRLGISAYLVIDGVTSGGKPREKIGLHLWRRTGGNLEKMQPDKQGWLSVPEMKIKVKSEAQKLLFADIESGDILLDYSQQRQVAEQERVRADQERKKAELEKQRAEQEKKRAETERLKAQQERQRADRLEAKLKAMGISPDEFI